MFHRFSAECVIDTGAISMSKRKFPFLGTAKADASFASNRSGNVTMAFGLSILIMFSTGGGAVDFARYHHSKAKLHAALDSAVLAGGRALQVSGSEDFNVAILAAQQYFEKMRPTDLIGNDPVFSVIENGTVLRAQANLSMRTPFLSMLGIDSLPANIMTEAAIAAGGNAGTNLEISLMLDMTGSMAGQKIADLKLAAKDLIDIVVWSDQSQYTSKVALAPFSARVNVGSYLDKVSDVQATRNFSGTSLKGITCVTERTGADEFTDEKPVSLATVSAFRGDKGNAARGNQNNYSSTGLCRTWSNGAWVEYPEIMPLSSDKTALKNRIDSLPAVGSTAGSLGTAWAWYLLSPKWNGIWQGENMPAPYSDITTLGPKGQPKLRKVAVLMSDGIYNTKGGTNYGDGSTEAQTISANAVTLCNNMKAAGIKVYTIGFQLGGNQLATDTLKACASRDADDPADSPSYFFSASSGSELRGAFRQIALQLATLRLRS